MIVGDGPYACGFIWESNIEKWVRPWLKEPDLSRMAMTREQAPHHWKDWEPGGPKDPMLAAKEL